MLGIGIIGSITPANSTYLIINPKTSFPTKKKLAVGQRSKACILITGKDTYKNIAKDQHIYILSHFYKLFELTSVYTENIRVYNSSTT